MELLAQIPLVGGLLGWAIPFLCVLTVVVFVHEFGHYWVGRMCGIRAEVFSIGFGKALLQRTDRHGTVWQVAAVPLGGYVRFVGDMDPASAGRADDENLTPEQQRVAFHNAGLWRRALTVAAGPVANFLLSIVVFALLVLATGIPSDKPVIGSLGQQATAGIGLEPGDKVLSIEGKKVESFSGLIDTLLKSDGAEQQVRVERDGIEKNILVRFQPRALITGVEPGSPAARAGLIPGDVIVSLNGKPVKSTRELQVATAGTTPGAKLELVIDRHGERRVFSFVPEMRERIHPVTGKRTLVPTMGVSLGIFSLIGPTTEPATVSQALRGGVNGTWMIISGSVIMIRDMIFNGADRSQIGGVIRIAKMSGERAERGFSSLVEWIAVLSTAIGLLNLFPIPILDGGHLMFYVFEGLRGRPVGETAMRIGTMIGLSLVLLLLVFATYNDLVWLL